MHSALLALIKLPATSLLHTRGGKKKRRGIRALLQRLRKVAERSVSDVASQQLQSVDVPEASDPAAARLSNKAMLAELRALSSKSHFLLEMRKPLNFSTSFTLRAQVLLQLSLLKLQLSSK